MGEKLDGQIRQDSGQTNGDTDRGNGQGASTSNPGTRPGGSGGRDGGSGGSGTAQTVQIEKPVQLALVDPDAPPRKEGETEEQYQKRIEKNRRKRERYAAQKSAQGGTVKPRKVNKAQPQAVPAIDTKQLELLITSVSSIVAARPGMEIWTLSPAEVKALAEPISNMVAKSEKLSTIGEHSDAVALVVACITIFVPRIIATSQMKKEEKKHARTGVTTDVNVKPDGGKHKERQVEKSDAKSNRPATPHSTGSSEGLSFLGDAIA